MATSDEQPLKLEYWETTLADDYIAQSVDALMASHDRVRLGIDVKVPADKKGTELALFKFAVRKVAWQRKLSFARTSVLFSALAVETAANLYINCSHDAPDAEALDRLRTPNKLLIAPRVAGHGELFQRDAHPMGDILRLFELRNLLVHPKIGPVGLGKSGRLTGKQGYEDFNPHKAATFLIAAADVIGKLAEALEQPALFGLNSRRISKDRHAIRKLAKDWRDQLPEEPEGALFRALMRERARTK